MIDGSKHKEPVVELLPDFVTMKECHMSQGKITVVIFREAKDIERLMPLREKHYGLMYINKETK